MSRDKTPQPKTEVILGSGPNFHILASDVSQAIHARLLRGMQVDAAVCCVASIVADYARVTYGNEYLPQLAKIILLRANDPLPDVSFVGKGSQP